MGIIPRSLQQYRTRCLRLYEQALHQGYSEERSAQQDDVSATVGQQRYGSKKVRRGELMFNVDIHQDYPLYE